MAAIPTGHFNDIQTFIMNDAEMYLICSCIQVYMF